MNILVGVVSIESINEGEVLVRDRSHDEAMAELYRSAPDFAIDLLNSILEDDDRCTLLKVLRQMAIAFGDCSINR